MREKKWLLFVRHYENLTLNVSVKKNSVLLSVETYRKKLSPLYWTIWWTGRGWNFPRQILSNKGEAQESPTAKQFLSLTVLSNLHLVCRSKVSQPRWTFYSSIPTFYKKKTVTIIKQGVSQRNHLPFLTNRNYLKQPTIRY